MLVRPGFEPTASRSADRRLSHWVNRAAEQERSQRQWETYNAILGKKSNWKIQRRERDLFRIIHNQVKMFKSLESDENDLPKFFSRWQDRLDLIDLIDDSIIVIIPEKQIIWKFHKIRLSICGADIFLQYS